MTNFPEGLSAHIMTTLGFCIGKISMVWNKYSVFETLNPLGVHRISAGELIMTHHNYDDQHKCPPYSKSASCGFERRGSRPRAYQTPK